MHYVDIAPEVAELAAEVENRLPEMIKNTVEQILDEMPVYHDAQFVSYDQLHESVRVNVGFVMRMFTGSGSPDLSQARALQGAPLPELLRAYRIGLTEVWHKFVELTWARHDLDGLVAATTAIWALVDDYAEALTTAYREATAELILTQQNRRSALVEALFAGGTEGSLWDIARVLELSLDGTFVVVAAEAPSVGQEPLPQMETRLRDRCHASAWRLTPDLQVGVVSMRDPQASQVLIELLCENSSGRIGVSPVVHRAGQYGAGVASRAGGAVEPHAGVLRDRAVQRVAAGRAGRERAGGFGTARTSCAAADLGSAG